MANWMTGAKLLLMVLLISGFTVFAQQAPNDAEAHARMLSRWMSMATGKQQAEVLSETTPALAAATDPKQRLDILFVRARAAILLPERATEKAPPLVEEFIETAPQDDRSAELLFRLARIQPTSNAQASIYQRTVNTYPTTYWGVMSKGALAQMDGLGKPFELNFIDAISGRPTSVQRDFKGKVVVIYFWATWCSDCTAETPQMKQLYAAYKDKGLEFIGVSLDEPESAGGLTKLKSYVEKNSIPWPQYFQGGDKQLSPFSSSWGVSSTPTVFVLDKEGKLFSTSAKGKLEQVINDALIKAS